MTALFFRAFPTATISTLEGMSDDDLDVMTYFFLQPKGKRALIKAW
jgi:hypothetical protein